jgi:GNAT superfamily N-acetyltransferase
MSLGLLYGMFASETLLPAARTKEQRLLGFLTTGRVGLPSNSLSPTTNQDSGLAGGRKSVSYLFILFVHPDYRRQGIGSRLLKWGMDKADDMAVEMFLDSTPEGKPLYESHQFHLVEKSVISPQTENPDDAWNEIKNKVGDSNWWLMWRPVHGKYEEGVTVKPWEKKQ